MIQMSTIKEAIEDMFNNRKLTATEAVERHFAPSFRQCVNGSWIDYSTFSDRIVSLREITEHVTITVLDEFSDGGRYAERHVIDLLSRDGSRTFQEVHLFAQRSQDGRFCRIEETTRAIESGE